MSIEHPQSIFLAGSGGRKAPSSAGLSSHAGSPTSAVTSAEAGLNNVPNQRQFLQSPVLTIVKQKNQMPRTGTMGAPIFWRPDVT